MAFPAVLVIGGGIAGMQAALDVGDAGYRVYLVERSPWIGGHMAQLDKTFPTNDCAMCTLSPRLSEVAGHPNITLLTTSEVIKVEGKAGEFKVTIRKKPRFVDPGKCNACEECLNVCPVSVPNEFDQGLSLRKAIYKPYPQAIPNAMAINESECRKCLKCSKVCEQKAIDHHMKEELLEVEVGAIIVATGFELFDPRKKPEFLYGRSPRVLTGLQLERLMCSLGPTGGEIRIEGRVPKRFVFIQCVGSRDRTVNHPYCSRVCCMYTAKQAYEVKERIPDAQVTICYMDVRAHGKGYEGLYERVQRKGVLYRRGIPSEIYERDGVLVVRGEDTLLGEPYELEADVIILATGLEPSDGVRELASVLGLKLDENGFFQEMTPLDPVLSTREGIFLAGCCQAPKDISDTVAHASGAAAKALALICGEKK